MTPEEIQAELSKPFPPEKLGWKPQAVKGNRAMACCYIDARDVMDRLDAVVGVGMWQDEYHVLPEGSVMCQLRVKVGGEWVTKADVGSPSEQPDGGDRLKAAFSDALKRTAVKYGVGRYLYSLPSVWCDYDPQKKQFTQTPQLPAWAIPKGAKQPARPTTPPGEGEAPAPQSAPATNGKAKEKPIASLRELWEKMDEKTPADGSKLVASIAWTDKVLVRLLGGEYTPGGLADAVREFAKKGEVADLAGLTGDPLTGAWGNAKQYVKRLETPVPAGK